MITKFFKRSIYVLLSVLLLIIIFFTIASLSSFNPPKENMIVSHDDAPEICDTCTYTMLSWNIGYCGLGDDMDFFYEGGEQVRASKTRTLKNCEIVNEFLAENDTVPFILLQEVDIKSARSYRINQLEQISETLPRKQPFFAKNYDAFFVPVPVTRPYGTIRSGLLALGDFKAKSASRHAFPGSYSWPVRLFMPNRCFLVTRYALPGQGQLVVVNTHNSAYDDGNLRTKEMAFLEDFLQQEYEQGHYVIVGGDWNQTPPSFEPAFAVRSFKDFKVLPVSDALLPGWTWSYDPAIPTNRSVEEIYKKGKTPVTVLDFYLTSPNIEILNIQTHDRQFRASDHQPVFLTFRLNGNKTHDL